MLSFMFKKFQVHKESKYKVSIRILERGNQVRKRKGGEGIREING